MPEIKKENSSQTHKLVILLQKEIEEIKARNRRVEVDKAWETSISRRILLMIFTYLSIGVYMAFVKISDPWLNAIVPTVAFFLSTLSLPFFRKLWEKHYYKSVK